MDDIREITLDNQRYPEALKKIPAAPGILYCRGNVEVLKETCFAVVGTRHPTPYGQQTALHIAGQLADANVVVVSGLAPGIDTFAHQAVVERGRKTIAVLGTGLDEKSIYPQQNLALSRKIIENGGCLISELPPGHHGAKYTFPRRNRIISALSQGVLVVEAKEKSGSLITTNYAKEYQKPLFAVPGPIFSTNSQGPHTLIKEGARLVDNANDILEALGITSLATARSEFPAENPEESLILSALQEQSLDIDHIIKTTKLSASSVASTLALMEISGKIRSLGANIYSIT